jgi:DNA-binding NtrC family response regulator
MAATPLQFFVVDDEPEVMIMMKAIFKKALQDGHITMEYFSNGQDALQKLMQPECLKNKTVILSDIMMPQMTGLELLDQVRSKFPQVSFFIMSAHNKQEYVDDAKSRGAIDYFVKPLDIKKVREMILAQGQSPAKAA